MVLLLALPALRADDKPKDKPLTPEEQYKALLQEQADAMEEGARDRLVVAFGIAVHSADAFIEAADDPRKLLVEVHVRPPKQQVGGRGKVRFMGPLLALQGAPEQAFPERLDLGVGMEKSRSIFSHRSGPSWARSATGP